MWLAAGSAINGPAVTAVVTLLVGLFGGGTGVALARVRVDKNEVVVRASQGAVIVQSTVIDDLQDELARVRADNAQIRADNAQLRAGLDEERQARAADKARYEREIASLRDRVTRMENGGGPGGWTS